MVKKYAIPTDIMLELRAFFHGRRSEIAEKTGMHYNSVTAVLKGDRYIEPILQTMVNILTENNEDEYALILSSKVVKLIKSKQRLQKAVAA